MTSKGKDPLDDEFEAFLAGEGELARQLSALRQPESPQRLNDAIMAAAEARMAREQATRGVAANDVGPVVAPVLRPSFTTRWRVPAAMAASVIGAVLLMLEWQRGDYAPQDRTEMREQAKVAAAPSRVSAEASASASAPRSASVSAPALAGASEPAPAEDLATRPSKQPSAPSRAKPAAPVMAKAADTTPSPSQAAVDRAPAPPIAKEPEGALAYAPPPAPAVPAQERMTLFARAAPAPPPAPRPAMAPAPAPAPAPIIALPAAAPMAFSPAPAIAPPPSPAAAPISVAGSAACSAIAPANDPKAAAWLNVIDEMLKADLRKDALDEWKKFRLAYPDYPVPVH